MTHHIRRCQSTNSNAGVAVCRLTSADVVRHPLVQRVVEAYARLDDQRVEQREEQGLARPSSRIVRR